MRIGAVSYLNTKPLIFQLSELAADVELILDVPGRLADRLAGGELDVALVPSVELLRTPGYKIVSDACIACRGPVLSVKLLSRVPVSDVKSLALDEGSRTSVALVQILLAERLGLAPRLTRLGLDDASWESNVNADAVLVIGDRAIHASQSVYSEQWDLGEKWWEWTGLPFVFAIWVARSGVETAQLESVLMKSRDAGVAHLEEIAESAAAGVGLDVDTCLSYLRDNLHFTLGPKEREGLRRFQQHAIQYGFVPAGNVFTTGNETGFRLNKALD